MEDDLTESHSVLAMRAPGQNGPDYSGQKSASEGSISGTSTKGIVNLTINFWRQETGKELTEEEAKEAIRNISGFFDTLYRWKRQEKNQEDLTRSHEQGGDQWV